MYYKGALMLNTIRHIINNDEKWWKIILDYSNTFKHKIIDTETVVSFFNKASGMDLTPVFNQYLRFTTIPTLDLKIVKNKLYYRWKATETNFNMPIDIIIKGKKTRILPTTTWKKSELSVKSLSNIVVLKNDFLVD
jgi:aminopeptidase N